MNGKKTEEKNSSICFELTRGKTLVWEKLGKEKEPIAVYGMGNGADKVLDVFKEYGIKPAAVMASDEFVRGQSFRGYKVKTLEEIERELGDFTVALCFATRLDEVIGAIYRLAERHKVLVPSVPAFGSVIFDRAFIEKYEDEIERAREIFADEKSREVYENILSFYYTGEISYLKAAETDKAEAFENILKLGKNETYLDIGAYNGDTVDEFLRYAGGYKRITALEPDKESFLKLGRHCGDMENVELWQLAAYSENTLLAFDGGEGRNSNINERGSCEVRAVSVDFILCGSAPSYVKADVEGADYEVLSGMKNTLKMFRPKLNFSAYHRFEDIFRLPLYIRELNPEYKIYLRHHKYIPAWDTNLYCV